MEITYLLACFSLSQSSQNSFCRVFDFQSVDFSLEELNVNDFQTETRTYFSSQETKASVQLEIRVWLRRSNRTKLGIFEQMLKVKNY